MNQMRPSSPTSASGRSREGKSRGGRRIKYSSDDPLVTQSLDGAVETGSIPYQGHAPTNVRSAFQQADYALARPKLPPTRKQAKKLLTKIQKGVGKETLNRKNPQWNDDIIFSSVLGEAAAQAIIDKFKKVSVGPSSSIHNQSVPKSRPTTGGQNNNNSNYNNNRKENVVNDSWQVREANEPFPIPSYALDMAFAVKDVDGDVYGDVYGGMDEISRDWQALDILDEDLYMDDASPSKLSSSPYRAPSMVYDIPESHTLKERADQLVHKQRKAAQRAAVQEALGSPITVYRPKKERPSSMGAPRLNYKDDRDNKGVSAGAKRSPRPGSAAVVRNSTNNKNNRNRNTNRKWDESVGGLWDSGDELEEDFIGIGGEVISPYVDVDVGMELQDAKPVSGGQNKPSVKGEVEGEGEREGEGVRIEWVKPTAAAALVERVSRPNSAISHGLKQQFIVPADVIANTKKEEEQEKEAEEKEHKKRIDLDFNVMKAGRPSIPASPIKSPSTKAKIATTEREKERVHVNARVVVSTTEQAPPQFPRPPWRPPSAPATFRPLKHKDKKTNEELSEELQLRHDEDKHAGNSKSKI